MADASSVQTVFGSIGSVIDQTTNDILKIESATARYKGMVPAVANPLSLSSYTSTQLMGIALLVVVAGLIVYVLYREFK